MVGHVYFAHGKESGPWGRKITALAEVAEARGWTTVSPDYSHTGDPDERVKQLLGHEVPRNEPLVLVGSSMGGYVSAVASASLQPQGLFLLAPAVDIPGYEADTTPTADLVEVVHGWQDSIIPAGVVVSWAERHRVRLHMLDSEHTLNDHLDWLCRAFDGFLVELGRCDGETAD